MTRVRWVLSLIWIALLVATGTAQSPKSFAFAGHQFTLQVPPGYPEVKEAGRAPLLKTFAFVTPARADGTRGLIQVSLIDLSLAPPGEVITLDRFADSQIAGVRNRRIQWSQSDSLMKIDGVRARRIEWTGTAQPAPGESPVSMRGVMITGIKDQVGFALHTQDFAKFASTAIPAGEKAMMTFSLTAKR